MDAVRAARCSLPWQHYGDLIVCGCEVVVASACIVCVVWLCGCVCLMVTDVGYARIGPFGGALGAAAWTSHTGSAAHVVALPCASSSVSLTCPEKGQQQHFMRF